MAEMDVLERRVVAALLGYASEVPDAVDAAAVARRVALEHPRRGASRVGWRPTAVPRVAWVLLLAALLVAVAGMLVVGAQQVRKVPAVVPPVDQVFACPPGTDPNMPGPVDQVVPPVYGWSPVAFDRRAGRLIALAANTEGSQDTWTVETWTFDVCTNTWTRMHPSREPPALVSSLVYDVDSNLTIGVHYEDWRNPYVIGNVWAYDLEANTWTELGLAPTDASGFYDPVSGLVVVRGLWTYDVETDTWTPIRPTVPRESLDYGAHAYDASVDRVITYQGGEKGVPETWLIDVRTGTRSRSSAETPVIRMGAWALPAIVYDEAAERTVVAGNFRWGAYDATGDRWEILFDIMPGENRPTPAVYDPVNRRLIVFGGGIGVSAELAAFDTRTRTWTVLLEPSEGQPAPSSE